MIEHLKEIKEIKYGSLGKIIQIIESTSLSRLDNHPSKYFNFLRSFAVIAVVLEEKELANYLFYYDFVVDIGPLSTKLSQDLTLKLLELIGFMKGKNIDQSFYPDDFYIEKRTGEIRIDCYGDRKYFKHK